MPAYLFKNPFTQSGRKACNIPHGQTGHVHDQKGRHSVGGRHGSPKTQTWWVSSNQLQESQEGGPWRVWRRWTPPRTSSSGAGMAGKLQGPGGAQERGSGSEGAPGRPPGNWYRSLCSGTGERSPGRRRFYGTPIAPSWQISIFRSLIYSREGCYSSPGSSHKALRLRAFSAFSRHVTLCACSSWD